jgi:hypothetical protein
MQPLMAGVSVALWLVAGTFVGVIACWVVALSDIYPIVGPEDGPARVPVSEYVYAGILVVGAILGLVASSSLRPRLHRGDDR